MRGVHTGIGVYCRNLIRRGFTRAVILRRALKKFPSSISNLACMDYYRRQIENGRID